MKRVILALFLVLAAFGASCGGGGGGSPPPSGVPGY
jgi:hypothetical protein